MTNPERLTLLLPWINGDRLSVGEARDRVFDFLHGFEATGIRTPPQAGLWEADAATVAELDATRAKLVLLLASGFWFSDEETPGRGLERLGWDDIALPLSFPSLRFAARRAVRGKRSRVTRGSYLLFVDGVRLRDLVPYLVMHLLTTEGIAVSRCPAPQLRHWDQRCNRFFVWTGRGRPPKVCPGGTCANRVKAKAKQDKANAARQEDEKWRRELHKKDRRKQRKR